MVLIITVGGLIGTATSSKDGLMSKDEFLSNRGTISGDSSPDNYILPGTYNVSNSKSFPFQNGTMIVYKSPNHIIQIGLEIRSSYMYIHRKWSTEPFQDWKKIQLSDL